jgi:monoamine oxidase
VRTLREPFAGGQHAEAGALFVPANHDLTLRYLRRFGQTIEPATPIFESRFVYARGRRILGNRGGGVQWPFDLAPEERTLGLGGMWDKYLVQALGEIGEVAAPGWPADPRPLQTLDGMTAAEYLRTRGASAEAVALLRIGYLDMYGDGIESYSALQMLARLALAQPPRKPFTVSGGAEQLPQALAARLAGRIRHESPAIRIEPGERSASVVAGKSGSSERFTADHVVCAIPASVLRRIEVSPAFSARKTRAIGQLPYTSVARVFLQFRRKAWTAENLYFTTTTDLPVRWIFEHTVNQPGRRGILEAQAFGADARRLCAMPGDARIDFALRHLEQVFPGLRADYERGTSVCWDDEPWARGAFAYFRPGQMLSFRPELVRAEGRVHFAGDHTSVWSGWMQGALESGLRAAREIVQAA